MSITKQNERPALQNAFHPNETLFLLSAATHWVGADPLVLLTMIGVMSQSLVL